MRRYNIVFGSLLILFIIDFGLAAPVLVQEKRHDLVQIPKDVRTLFGKRAGDEDIAKLAQDYLETGGKSSDTNALSNSAPPVPDHGPMGAVDANGGSSTAKQGSSTESASPSSAVQPPLDFFNDFITPWTDDVDAGYSSDLGYHQTPKQTPNPKPDPGFSYSYSYPYPFESPWRSSGSVVPDRGSTGGVEASGPNPASSTASPEPERPWSSMIPDLYKAPFSDDESPPVSGYSSEEGMQTPSRT